MPLICLIVLVASGQNGNELAQHEKLELRTATPNAATVSCYGLFELNLDLRATYDNPFDPDDIDVCAEFIAPDGKPVRVNGFFTQSCTRKLENDSEHIDLVGEPFWQIRFAPNCEGVWHYRVHAKDRTGTVSLPEAEFKATSSSNPGFVRRNARSPHIFAFDDGRPFVAIGENMCWGAKRGSFDYDDWLAALGHAGGNWIRLWMYRWNCCIEWSAEDKRPWDFGQFGGLGVYNLSTAWKLDTILDTAEKNGVYAMVTFGTYGEFTTGGFFNEGMWSTNPYNAANGGPCAKPDDFWTDEKARKMYMRRLRYIAARYGWRTNVCAWEFWNEAICPAAWVAEMAQFMKGKGPFEGKAGRGRPGADPYGHLVSTSYGNAETWAIPEIDFTQTHHYGEGNIADTAPVAHGDACQHRKFEKPHLLAEFGIDWRSSDDKYDTQFQGINLHNALWASLLSGNAGGAMIWYWDGYIHPGNLYPQFGALRRFSDKVPWAEGPWKPLDIDPPQAKVVTEAWQDLVIAPSNQWGKSGVKEFTITPTKGAGGDPLPSFMYGPLKPELRVPLVLHVNYEKAGRFDAKVNSVSAVVRFALTLDGGAPTEITLSSIPPEKEGVKPEYETTEFRKEYGIYQARFNKKYGLDVPAGEHTITMDVVDGDWLNVSDYTFAGYVSNRFARANVFGLTNGTTAIFWAQNADHNWLNVKENKPIAPIGDVRTALHGLPVGAYGCEWWDTWKGEPSGQDKIVCAEGALPVLLPKLEKDVAAIIRPE